MGVNGTTFVIKWQRNIMYIRNDKRTSYPGAKVSLGTVSGIAEILELAEDSL